MRVCSGEEERLKVVGAEVLGDTVRGARGPDCATDVRLRDAEHALKAVRRGWYALVIVAVEELAPIASGFTGDVINKRTGGGAEAGARSVPLKFFDLLAKALVGLVTIGRWIASVWIWRDLVRDLTEDFDVSRDPTSSSGAVPIRSQCLIELVQDRMVAFFFFASCTKARTFSSFS